MCFLCRGQHAAALSRHQLTGQLQEEVLLRVLAAQHQPDGARVAGDDGADLQQLQADGVDLGLGEGGALKVNPTQPLQEQVGQPREQQSVLIGPPFVAAGAVGEQELLLHIAGVEATPAGLGLDDHPSSTLLPALGSVLDEAEDTLLLPTLLEADSRRVVDVQSQLGQALVAGEADDVIDAVAVAPVENQRTAESAVASEDDLHLRPRLAQPPDQQGEDGAGVVSGIQRGRTQVADQQLVATEHEQRQEDVVVVVAVEVPPELLAMHPIGGSIEVEVERLLGWPPERADELLDHLLVDGDRPVPVSLLLEAAQGGLTGQHAIGIDGGLQGDIVTQRLVVVEILVAQRQAKHALPNQGFGAMQAALSVALVAESASDGAGQAHLAIELPQQQDTAVGSDITAIETGDDLTAFAAWKGSGRRGTFCHGG